MQLAQKSPSWMPCTPNVILARALREHPARCTADYIRPLLGESPDAVLVNNLALALNVYPSTLRAYAAGEAYPSDNFADRFGVLLGLNPAYVDAIKAHARAELSAIRSENPKRALLIRVIGQASADTTLPIVLQKILYASRHVEEGEVGFATKDVCEQAGHHGYPLNPAVIGGIKNDTPDQARKYSDKIIMGLVAGFGLEGAGAASILEDIASRNVPLKPFGAALEEFARQGGKSFVEFYRRYKDTHHLTNEGLSAVTGIAKQRFVDWGSEDAPAIDESSLHTIAGRAQLTPFQTSLLWHMARGDTSLPAVKDIIAQAKTKMAAIDYMHAGERHKVAGEVWDKLYKFCGFAPESFAEKVDITRKTVHSWAESITPDVDSIKHATNAGKIFIPYDEALAEDAAALLLSIPGKRDKHELLLEVAEGKMKIGELVREIRLQKRHTVPEAAQHITYAPDGESETTRSVERHEVTLVEQGKNDCMRTIAEAYAKYCGFEDGEEHRIFMRSIMGQKACAQDAGGLFKAYLQKVSAMIDPDKITKARKALLHELRNNQGLTTREAVQEMNHLLPEDKVTMAMLEYAEQNSGQMAPSVIPAVMRVYDLDADYYNAFAEHFARGPRAVRQAKAAPAPAGAMPEHNPAAAGTGAGEVEFLPDDKKWVWRPESQVLHNLGFHTPIPAAPSTEADRRTASDALVNEVVGRKSRLQDSLKPAVAQLMERIRELDQSAGNNHPMISDFTRRKRRSELVDREVLASSEVSGLAGDAQGAIKWGIRAILFPEDGQGEKMQLQHILASVTDETDLRRKALRMVIEELLADTTKRYALPSYTDTVSKQTLPSKTGGYAIRELIAYHKFQADRISNYRFSVTSVFGHDEERSEERVEAAKRPVIESYFIDPRVVKMGIITPAMVEAKLQQLGVTVSPEASDQPVVGAHTAGIATEAASSPPLPK